MQNQKEKDNDEIFFPELNQEDGVKTNLSSGSDSLTEIPVEKTSRSKLSGVFSSISENFNEFIERKGLTEQKELLFFEIRDNIILIGILIATVILASTVAIKAPELTKNYEKKVNQVTALKKEILTYQKKTQGNERYKDFSDLLQYGVKIGESYFPSAGYLSEFKKLYPTKEALNFGTFTEGWTSDFIAWRGEKIRVPKDILKEYRVASEQEIDAESKKITYSLKLEGSEDDINKYLGLLSSLKLVNEITEIKEVRKNEKEIMSEATISFYLRK